MATASVRMISTNTLGIVGHRLRPNHLVEGAASMMCTSCDVDNISSPSNVQQQYRLLSSTSIRYPSSISQTISKSSSPFIPPTSYSALRTKMTMPFEVKGGKYVSPYAEFFTNIDAGRTTLGTTEEMEQRALELQEQCLKCGIKESDLRFRTRSYGRFVLPPHVSPGEHRVIVKVALSVIPFKNYKEKDVFMKIVGSRFNQKKGDLQLSSEKFASRIENKRYLVDMIEKIVFNAKKLAKEFDDDDNDSAKGREGK